MPGSRISILKEKDSSGATQPPGIYASAASASQLNNAFTTMASEILRLTR